MSGRQKKNAPKADATLNAPTAPPSAKDRTKQAVALCHDLIATAGYPIARSEQVKAALNYLEDLFKAIEAAPEQPEAPVTLTAGYVSVQQPEASEQLELPLD
jgi:hypothetical protein